MTRRSLILALVAMLAACSVEKVPLVASDVDIRKPMPGMNMSAGYLTLTNNTEQSIIITHVTSPQFGSVELHESVLEDGVSRMYALGNLTILPGHTVRFEPGGKHLMLMRPSIGADEITLDFHAGKAVILTINTSLMD